MAQSCDVVTVFRKQSGRGLEVALTDIKVSVTTGSEVGLAVVQKRQGGTFEQQGRNVVSAQQVRRLAGGMIEHKVIRGQRLCAIF